LKSIWNAQNGFSVFDEMVGTMKYMSATLDEDFGMFSDHNSGVQAFDLFLLVSQPASLFNAPTNIEESRRLVIYQSMAI
jgi:hypothetical protein